MAKAWHLLPYPCDAIERLAAETGLPVILAQVLHNRGLCEAAAVDRFLNAPFTGLLDPSELPGVAEATALLMAAVREGQRICVYGDYDADGLTGTAVLLQTLRLLGAKVDYYVPHRLDEGYGLSAAALAQVAASGARVVVTVDCGIASLEEADEARRLGLILIVTDHHEPKDRLPDAAAIVHPRAAGRTYPFGELSGSGVAFKLAWALCQAESGAKRVTPRFRDFLVESIGLAALGMVADWVPLLDENRIIVRHGLARLARTEAVGLRALLDAAGLARKSELSATDVSFGLAPRLNAAGRLGCARLVVELLTTESRQRALEITRFLEGQNQERQAIERKILDQAKRMAEGFDAEGAPALVLASAEWHAGVIGIVAGRLADLFGRPVLMVSLRDDGTPCPGSGRSVPGFALHEALAGCADHLVNHGGHAAAAGFRVLPDRLDALREQFCARAADHFARGSEMPQLRIDAEVPLAALTLDVVDALGRLEPYGSGNPRPTFLAGPVDLVGEPRRVGRGERHLQFRVKQGAAILPAVAFNGAERASDLSSAGGTCCLVFRPSVNEWNGRRSVQLEAVDFQPGPRAVLA